MLSHVYRELKFLRTKIVSKAYLSTNNFNIGCKNIDPLIILNRDLYKSNAQVNSSKRIPYLGPEPSFYLRSSTDFESKYLDSKGLGNNRILETLELDKDFELSIQPRTDHIQAFLGDDFPLLLNEKLGILCGLSNFPISIKGKEKNTVTSSETKFNKDCPQKSFPHLSTDQEYTTEKLRSLGKVIFDLHLGLGTFFSKEKYLSLPLNDLEHSMNLFRNERLIIPQFMKRNFVYNCILQYRGTMRSGVIHASKEYEETRAKLQDVTSIGSFYTMIGILSVKFDRDEVVQKIVYGKIINGPRGLINIATENITTLRN